MKTSFLSLLFVSWIALLSTGFCKEEKYHVDVVHSSVGFKVSHFFSKVPGRFEKFSGTLLVDRDHWEKSSVRAEIETASINTDNEGRDKHLKNSDFFDVEKFPKIVFESKSWKKTADNEFEVSGDFVMHGVTKSVVLHVKSLGFGEGMKGTKLSGWEAKTTLKRSDFGMTTGAPAVGDEVEIEINIEAHLEEAKETVKN
jgi:polyisoprenoid-binding protein YceI